MIKVFLGGTCNESKWRETIIPLLVMNGIDYFNPVVPDWTPECQEEEIKQRESCDIVLYCITPKMTGVYSIAEVVDDSNKRPDKTIFTVLDEDNLEAFSKAQLKSLVQVSKLIVGNGGKYFSSLNEVVDYISKIK